MEHRYISKDPAIASESNLPDYDTLRAHFTWQSARRTTVGGNIAHEAVDRHVAEGRGDVIAFRFLAEQGPSREFSYELLARESNRFANVLERLGVAPGDLVFTLSGRLPELYVAMIGTLKVRCVVAPLFSAFGPDPVRQRLQAGRGRVLITTAAAYRQKVAPIRGDLPDLEHVLLIGDDRLRRLARRIQPSSTSRAARPACRRAPSMCTMPWSPKKRPGDTRLTSDRETSSGARRIRVG